MSMAPANVSGRLVRRPTTAAASDATSRNVNWISLRPRIRVRSTPAKPASEVPTIQAPAVMAEVLIPEIRAVRGESTAARIESPIGVMRMRIVSSTAIAVAATITAAWFSFTLMPRTPKMSGGPLTRPWASKTSDLLNGNRIFTRAGSATQRPTVETNRTSGGAWVSRRNNAHQRNSPSSGHITKIVKNAAAGIDQPCSWFSQ